MSIIGPRSDVSQPLRSRGVPLTTVWCWFESCRGRQQNQQLIDFDFFYATGNSHIDRASLTACLQVWLRLLSLGKRVRSRPLIFLLGIVLMVYEAERHEALDGSDWNEATAREFIERVAAEANKTFSPGELWPTHPLEELR